MEQSLRKRMNFWVAISLLLAFTGYAHGLYSSVATALDSLEGAWTAADGTIVNFEPRRVILSSGSTLSVLGIVRKEPSGWVLRKQGLLETWTIKPSSDSLSITIDGAERVFRALADVPPAVQLRPATVADAQPISPARLAEIQREISERASKGQAVRQDRSRWPEMAGVDAENTKYLKEILQEAGWLDLQRFGLPSARDAFLLVQHSSDLPLMMAAMPYIEKDFKHSEGAQSFALLYDRLQLSLGQKQFYGTQIGMDKEGSPFLFPLEAPESVDDRLKDLGLPPLREYLAEAGKVLFNGKEVRLSSHEE